MGLVAGVAGNLFGLHVTVFQVRVSYDQKPCRRALMETYRQALPMLRLSSWRDLTTEYRPVPQIRPLARQVKLACSRRSIDFSNFRLLAPTGDHGATGPIRK